MKKVIDSVIEQLNSYANERTVIIDSTNNREYNNLQFCKKLNGLSRYISQEVEEGIIVCADNSFELVLLYFACMVSGKVIIPVDPEKESGEISKIIELHDKAEFWAQGKLSAVVGVIEESQEKAVISWNDIDTEKLYLITYTSGSTGNPKGVCHNIKNLFWAAQEFAEQLGYDERTVMGHCMPMTYMAGILNTIVMPYISGGCIVVLPRFSMKNAFTFWDTIKRNQVNTLWLSPTMLRILNLIDKKGDMKSYFHLVRMKISVGTAPLDKALREEVESKYEWRIYQSYGLSETLFISTETLDEKISNHTVGRLLPSVKLQYAPDGEILIDVPWMFLKYTNVDTGQYMYKGSYLSGDLGHVNKDANLIIRGRKKDLIVKGGYNVNPGDIENFLTDNRIVSECAVVSLNIRGEEMIAACYTAEKAVDFFDINRQITEQLGKHCRIDYLDRVQVLPKNLNGKVDKLKIKKEMELKYGTKV